MELSSSEKYLYGAYYILNLLNCLRYPNVQVKYLKNMSFVDDKYDKRVFSIGTSVKLEGRNNFYKIISMNFNADNFDQSTYGVEVLQPIQNRSEEVVSSIEVTKAMQTTQYYTKSALDFFNYYSSAIVFNIVQFIFFFRIEQMQNFDEKLLVGNEFKSLIKKFIEQNIQIILNINKTPQQQLIEIDQNILNYFQQSGPNINEEILKKVDERVIQKGFITNGLVTNFTRNFNINKCFAYIDNYTFQQLPLLPAKFIFKYVTVDNVIVNKITKLVNLLEEACVLDNLPHDPLLSCINTFTNMVNNPVTDEYLRDVTGMTAEDISNFHKGLQFDAEQENLLAGKNPTTITGLTSEERINEKPLPINVYTPVSMKAGKRRHRRNQRKTMKNTIKLNQQGGSINQLLFFGFILFLIPILNQPGFVRAMGTPENGVAKYILCTNKVCKFSQDENTIVFPESLDLLKQTSTLATRRFQTDSELSSQYTTLKDQLEMITEDEIRNLFKFLSGDTTINLPKKLENFEKNLNILTSDYEVYHGMNTADTFTYLSVSQKLALEFIILMEMIQNNAVGKHTRNFLNVTPSQLNTVSKEFLKFAEEYLKNDENFLYFPRESSDLSKQLTLFTNKQKLVDRNSYKFFDLDNTASLSEVFDKYNFLKQLFTRDYFKNNPDAQNILQLLKTEYLKILEQKLNSIKNKINTNQIQLDDFLTFVGLDADSSEQTINDNIQSLEQYYFSELDGKLKTIADSALSQFKSAAETHFKNKKDNRDLLVNYFNGKNSFTILNFDPKSTTIPEKNEKIVTNIINVLKQNAAHKSIPFDEEYMKKEVDTKVQNAIDDLKEILKIRKNYEEINSLKQNKNFNELFGININNENTLEDVKNKVKNDQLQLDTQAYKPASSTEVRNELKNISGLLNEALTEFESIQENLEEESETFKNKSIQNIIKDKEVANVDSLKKLYRNDNYFILPAQKNKANEILGLIDDAVNVYKLNEKFMQSDLDGVANTFDSTNETVDLSSFQELSNKDFTDLVQFLLGDTSITLSSSAKENNNKFHSIVEKAYTDPTKEIDNQQIYRDLSFKLLFQYFRAPNKAEVPTFVVSDVGMEQNISNMRKYEKKFSEEPKIYFEDYVKNFFRWFGLNDVQINYLFIIFLTTAVGVVCYNEGKNLNFQTPQSKAPAKPAETAETAKPAKPAETAKPDKLEVVYNRNEELLGLSDSEN